MQPSIIRSIRGYAAVTIRGKGLEALLNRSIQAGYMIWDIRRTCPEEARAYILLRDFFRLRALLKETGCRVHVVGRHGAPFLLNRLGQRKFYFAGLACFLVGIYMQSLVIWQVKVEGNDSLSTYEVLQAAQHEGIKPYQWTFRLKPLDELARGLHQQLPSVSWVGVEKQGTRIVIRVVESAKPDEHVLLSPRHLVATKSAVVSEVLSTKGKPVVEPNRYVRKGDVLVSGILGDETHSQTVPAEGKVKGIVWYESKVEVPLTRRYKTYTGEGYDRFYLVLGSRALQVTGYKKPQFATQEVASERKTVGWREYALPIGWMTETIRETNEETRQEDEAQARSAGLERAKADILMSAGADASLRTYQVLSERSENDRLYMQVLFQVEEVISEELPIVQEAPPAPAPAQQ